MTTVTSKQVRERIEAILDAVPQIATVITDEDTVLTDAQLPAAIVMTRGATRTKEGTGLYRTVRTFEIGVLIKRLQEWTAEEQREQMTAAEDFLEVLPDAFARLDRLALNRQPLAGVHAVSLMSDAGLETREFGSFNTYNVGNVYYAVTYSLEVTTNR